MMLSSCQLVVQFLRFFIFSFLSSVFTGDTEDRPTSEYKFYFRGHLDNVVNLLSYNYIP